MLRPSTLQCLVVKSMLMSVHLLLEVKILLHLPRRAHQIKCCAATIKCRWYVYSMALRCCTRSCKAFAKVSLTPKAQVATSVSSKQSSLVVNCDSFVQRCSSWCHVQSMFTSDGMLWSTGQRGF